MQYEVYYDKRIIVEFDMHAVNPIHVSQSPDCTEVDCRLLVRYFLLQSQRCHCSKETSSLKSALVGDSEFETRFANACFLPVIDGRMMTS